MGYPDGGFILVALFIEKNKCQDLLMEGFVFKHLDNFDFFQVFTGYKQLTFRKTRLVIQPGFQQKFVRLLKPWITISRPMMN